MRILMIACSRNGIRLMQRVQREWSGPEWICKVKCAAMPELTMPESVSRCVADWFHRVDGMIFFAAAGIAVRAIAPCLDHKSTDPGVVVVDETGRFCISLLSGHMGGGNELAERIAEICGALPVVTTATDREGLFAVDVYARRHDLGVTDWELAKRISAALLEGKRIGFYIDAEDRWLDRQEYVEDFPPEVFFLNKTWHEDHVDDGTVLKTGAGKNTDAAVPGMEPEENVGSVMPGTETKEGVERFVSETGVENDCEMGICISTRRTVRHMFSRTLQLVPTRFVVGIGCRRGCLEERIQRAVEDCLEQLDIRMEAVSAIATIDLKKEEAGLVRYCRKQGWKLMTFSAEELKQLSGCFSESAFVGQVTGVTNVCERSAVAAAGTGAQLVCPKQIHDGVTTAVAVSGWCMPDPSGTE